LREEEEEIKWVKKKINKKRRKKIGCESFNLI
jgi:hypothetical protein